MTSLRSQPGAYVAHDGTAVVVKNVICIHEEDAGLLWKHTDFRVGGRGHAVRARRLVVQMICTLANYGACPALYPTDMPTDVPLLQSTSSTTCSTRMATSSWRSA